MIEKRTIGWRKSNPGMPDMKKLMALPPGANPFEVTPETAVPATRFFDNMSFIGGEQVGCFLVETSVGLVLMDCINADQYCVEVVEKGIRDLGYEPADLIAIVLSHGHGDHFGQSGYFQKTYGTKVYMSEPDVALAQTPVENFPWEPIDWLPDEYLVDGKPLTFGDVTIECCMTPGHTDGCFSFIIPVTDEGVPHKMALWGGSGVPIQEEGKNMYRASWEKFSRLCDMHGVDGEIATHPFLDMSIERLTLVRNIVDGVPNPFVLGRDNYKYYEKKFLDACNR